MTQVNNINLQILRPLAISFNGYHVYVLSLNERFKLNIKFISINKKANKKSNIFMRLCMRKKRKDMIRFK